MTASAAADNDDDDELKEESVCFDSGQVLNLFPRQRGAGPALEESLVPARNRNTHCSSSRSWVSY